MAYIWFRDDDRQWSVVPLSDKSFDIESSPPKTVKVGRSKNALERGVILAPTHGEGRNVLWAVLWKRSKKIKVNGLRMATGIRALIHGDEIKVGDNPPSTFLPNVSRGSRRSKEAKRP